MEILHTSTATPLSKAMFQLSEAPEMQLAPEEARGALVELICNIYEHARHSVVSVVEWGVDATFTGDSFQVDVWDAGRGFCPEQTLISNSLGDVATSSLAGGRGLGLSDLQMLAKTGIIRAAMISSMGKRAYISQAEQMLSADNNTVVGARVSLAIDIVKT